MSNYLFDKIVLSTPVETLFDLRTESQLDFFQNGVIVKTIKGNSWQFEINEERIAFYEDARGGQDMLRQKGTLVFLVRMQDVGYFEESQFSPHEMDFWKKFHENRSDYLNKKINETEYNLKKSELLKLYSELDIEIPSSLELPHEWMI